MDEVPTVLTKLQKWGDYESTGAPVAPTRFVPMKTPLSQAILGDWSLPQQPRYRLTVPELLEDQVAAGRRVGLLLDLSNHDCLYSEDIPHVSVVGPGDACRVRGMRPIRPATSCLRHATEHLAQCCGGLTGW